MAYAPPREVGPHKTVVQNDLDRGISQCVDCGATWPDGGYFTPYCTPDDWLQSRILEVTEYGKPPTRTYAPQPPPPPGLPMPKIVPAKPRRSGAKTVVLIKMRVTASEERWMKKEFGRWVERGIEGSWARAAEKDVPRWYDRFDCSDAMGGQNLGVRTTPKRNLFGLRGY